MMLRDKIKDELYFNEVSHKVKSALIDEKRVTRFDESTSLMTYYDFANGLYNYIFIAYSAGTKLFELVVPCGEMLDLYTKSIDTKIDYSDGGDIIYTELLNMVSMGLLLNREKELLKLSTVLHGVGFKDHVIDFLLKSMSSSGNVEERLMWPDDVVYKKLIEIINSDKSNAESEMRNYLQSYFYTQDNLEDQYDIHKKAGRVYKGYWSFDSAAIVKVMRLDDSTFKDSPYYPVDMLYEEQVAPEGHTSLSFLVNNNSSENETDVGQPALKPKKWWQF